MVNIYSHPQQNTFPVNQSHVFGGSQIDQRPAVATENRDPYRAGQILLSGRESTRAINTTFNTQVTGSSPVLLNRMPSGAINPTVSSFDLSTNSPTQQGHFFGSKDLDQSPKPIHLQIDPNSSPINIPAHHGKSLRSIQLFENPNNAPFAQVHHALINPTVKASLYDPLPIR